MTPPCPYGPDRSLQIAIALLVGGGLFATAALYLLVTSAETFTGPYQARLTEAQMQQQARSAARRSPRRFAPGARRNRPSRRFGNTPFATSAPGRVPAWAGSGPSPPPRIPAQGLYDLRPDMSYAELGPPPNGQEPGLAGAGVSRGDGASPTGGLPEAGGDPLTADLGSGASSKSTSWRSDVSRLGDQARALGGALAHLDRSGRSAGGDPGTGTSGDATAASAKNGRRTTSAPPDPPGSDEPPQVPVDGGLGWLAAAGAAYAANRLRKQREEDKLDDAA